MGRFGERIGTVEALAWASRLSLGVAVVVLLVVRRGVGDLGDAWSSPNWIWLGAVAERATRPREHDGPHFVVPRRVLARACDLAEHAE
jgi:hypothetical protein